MGKIDDQIKELERKRAKIELIQQVQDSANKLKSPEGHKDLAKEVRELIQKMTDQAINMIEGKVEVDPPVPIEDEPLEKVPPKSKINPQLQLVEFVKKYGTFSFKKVTAITLDGGRVTGVVKQVQYPNILVESEKGGLLEVQPESLELK